MSVCPKCGYPILTSWRQNRWRTNVFFLQWDQTEDIDHELLKKLKENPHEIQTDKNYAYRNAGRVIERILLSEYLVAGSRGFHVPREHKNHGEKT